VETIKQIPITELESHPDNPRLVMREDVVNGIAEQLKEAGHFDPAHALLVRPFNGYYQIVRGHQRWEAAKIAGIGNIPCWVREMSDEEAYMQLALGNVQGELSPLEIGVHALRVDDRGLREYARQIGNDPSHISSYRQGAEVLQYIKCGNIATLYVHKANHLAAIHSTSQELWPLLAQWVITPEDDEKKQPSVNQVKEIVKTIKKFEIPEEWQSIFLPLIDIVKMFMQDGAPTPSIISDLVSKARTIQELIAAQVEGAFSYTVDGFHDWLRGGIGSYAWEPSALDEYRSEVIEAVRKSQEPPKPDAKQGEWYKLGYHLLYCGDTGQPEFWQDLPQAAFAFADPPYNAGVDEWDEGFEWAHDWLIDKAPIAAVTPGIESIQDFYAKQTQMPHAWAMSAYINNGMTRGKLGFGNWVYIGLFARPDMSIHRKAQDHVEVSVSTSDTEDSEHKGRKPPELMQRLIELFTKSDEVVIDPFLGSGTTLFEANKLGRKCIGGEIRPAFCNEIIARWQEESGQVAERIE
jgi:ParB/RepB/Spo0J family partition protein